MPTYFLEQSDLGAESSLTRLLPRVGSALWLRGPDDGVICEFTPSAIRVFSTSTVYGKLAHEPFFSVFAHRMDDVSIMAEVCGEGLDDKMLVLRILRSIRDRHGGVLMDEDGRVLD